MNKKVKQATIENKIKCFFCGAELNEKNRTKEHVIPKSIYHTNKLIIRKICKKCNNDLGKFCEQPAIPYLKEMMAELILEGYPLKFGRRRNKSQYIVQSVGHCSFKFGDRYECIPCIMQIDTVNKQRQFDLEPSWVKKDHIDFSKITSNEGMAIFPLNENDGTKEMQKLGQKIIFELCYLIWKEDFLLSEGAKKLKDLILNDKLDDSDIELLDWENPLFNWKYLEGNEEIKKKRNPSQISMFDNPPHITFAALKIEDFEPILVLNLFGMFETTIRLFKNDFKMNEILEKEQAIIILIEQTGKKEILKLNPEKYLRRYSKSKS